jgi:hypothetical protein
MIRVGIDVVGATRDAVMRVNVKVVGELHVA